MRSTLGNPYCQFHSNYLAKVLLEPCSAMINVSMVMQRAQWTGAKRHFSSPLPRESPLIRSLSLHLGTCTVRDDQPKLLLQLSSWKLSKSWTHSLKKPVFSPHYFRQKPFFFPSTRQSWEFDLWNQKKNVIRWECCLDVVKCVALVHETQDAPPSVRGRVVLCMQERKKQTKDKNDCEAVKKEEERWTDNSGRNVFGVFFF